MFILKIVIFRVQFAHYLKVCGQNHLFFLITRSAAKNNFILAFQGMQQFRPASTGNTVRPSVQGNPALRAAISARPITNQQPGKK